MRELSRNVLWCAAGAGLLLCGVGCSGSESSSPGVGGAAGASASGGASSGGASSGGASLGGANAGGTGAGGASSSGGTSSGGAAGNPGSGGASADPCPADPPADASPCTTGSCFYERCGSFGRVSAECTGGKWKVQSASCASIPCGGSTCSAGQACLTRIGGAFITECTTNTCDGLVRCDCIGGCYAACQFGHTLDGGVGVTCNTCPQGNCP